MMAPGMGKPGAKPPFGGAQDFLAGTEPTGEEGKEDLEDIDNLSEPEDKDEDEPGGPPDEDDEEASANADKTKLISDIADEMVRLQVQGHFEKIALQDGFFGRAHLYIDTGDTDNPDELQQPLGDGRNDISKAKVTPDHPVQRLVPVEAVWCYPVDYNSTDPLATDWYKPTMWMVQGKRIHASRLLTFVGRLSLPSKFGIRCPSVVPSSSLVALPTR
jgi:hypothetical protein